MESKIQIREVIFPEELTDIASIVLNSFVTEINGHIKELEGTDITNHDKFYEFYYDRVEAGVPFVIYVAELGGEIIGASGGCVDEHHWGNEKWGSEDFWFVKKEHRGGKTGLILFNKLIDWFKENGAKRIHMTHYTWNPKVENFYNKKGFKPFEVSYVYEVEPSHVDGKYYGA
tara:strand:- start:36 stop:554 length:519 start_codon:yes stop_codon:yes gene_type:complete